MEKKTEIITYRTTQTVKNLLEKEAQAKRWSISQLTEVIIQEYIKTKVEQISSDTEK